MNHRTHRPMSTRQFTPPNVSARGVALVVLAVLLLGAIISSVFTVAPEEVGVIQTFGKYTPPLRQPGLQLKAPWPFQTVTKVPVQRQLKQEFGFRTATPGVRTRYRAGAFDDESLMLTGDLNVAVVEWITQYRIADPYRALFNVRSLTETFRDMNETVMRTVVGDRSVTEVLTIGREEIATEVERRLQELCDQYETGLTIEQIVLQDVNPPDEVKPSFNEVNQAEQERDRMINEAKAEFNRVIPRARGEAEQVIQEAEGYAADRVNRARGDAARFDALLTAYSKAPEVTRRRIYLETMQTVLPAVERKVVVGDNMRGLLPLLSLDREGK